MQVGGWPVEDGTDHAAEANCCQYGAGRCCSGQVTFMTSVNAYGYVI